MSCADIDACVCCAGSSLDFSGPQSVATALGVLAAIIAIHEVRAKLLSCSLCIPSPYQNVACTFFRQVLSPLWGFTQAGHFAAARAQGIHVTKFAIGFGPAVLSYQVCYTPSCALRCTSSQLLLQRCP